MLKRYNPILFRITVSDGESKIDNVYVSSILIDEMLKEGENPIIEMVLAEDLYNKKELEIPEKLEALVEINEEIF